METELQILDFIQSLRTPAGDVLIPMITRLANGGLIWIILAAALILYPKTRKSGMILAAALIIDFVLCNMIMKPLFARIRPCDVNTSVQLLIARPADFSFPSGHTAVSFTAVSALFCTCERKARRLLPLLPEHQRTGKLWLPALILAILISLSRLYLYVHYPTDIAGGIVVGIFSGYAAYWLAGRLGQAGSQ